MHLLLIDDDDDEREIFIEALQDTQLPFKFSYVRNAKHALQQLNFISPDLIFVDINMPFMNGIECLKEIKKTVIGKTTPVIIYSTTVDYIRQSAIKEGASDCIKKMNSIKNLTQALVAVLNNKYSF